MRRPLLFATLGVLVLGGVGLALRKTGPSPTPPPTESQLRAFVRRAPNAFGPLIAQRERSFRLKSWPVPVAVGIGDGAKLRVHHPSRFEDGNYESHLGRYWGAGTYAGDYDAPDVLQGTAVDSIVYYRPHEHHECFLAVSGRARRSDLLRPSDFDALLSEGRSTKRDLGRLPLEGGQYALHNPGSMSDGFRFTLSSGAPPRRIALAPDELQSETRAEPEGYALLYDEMILWRDRTRYDEREEIAIDGLPLPRPFGGLFQWISKVSSYVTRYRVTGIAHVYYRRDGRWRYARSWSLEGSGRATITTDDPTFKRRRGASPGSVQALGAPDTLKADSAFPLER